MGVKADELQKSAISLSEAEEFVRDMIDIHVHGPDKIPRRYNPDGVDLIAEKGKIAGIVLKSHLRKDMMLIANRITHTSEGILKVFGSLTLNNGFKTKDVDSVRKKAADKPFFIWGPTVAAKFFLDNIEGDYAIPESWVKGSSFSPIRKDTFRPVSCLDSTNKLTKESLEVLKVLSGTKGIFASGHLSGIETYMLGVEARKRDIPFIATHVLLGDRSPLPEKQMEELVKRGVWLEFCYIFLKDEDWDWKYNRKQIVAQIKKFISRVVVSTDCGQVRNMPPSSCMTECVRLLSAYGVTKKELTKIMIDNPRKILGLHQND